MVSIAKLKFDRAVLGRPIVVSTLGIAGATVEAGAAWSSEPCKEPIGPGWGGLRWLPGDLLMTDSMDPKAPRSSAKLGVQAGTDC